MTQDINLGATPSDRHLAWHELETYGFVHFTLNTFTDREWGYGDEDPALFNPEKLDCDQWVATAKSSGLGGLILTAKHHDGFCLWPTKTTEHNISQSPFRDGKGDLVKELSEACLRGGIKLGIYCSPWDRNHPEYAREAYVRVYHEQWRELLTNYGPLFEVWLDGANGGDGYYGGACEKRSIDSKTYYRNDELLAMFRNLQPDAVVSGGPGADLRWCGNEHGFTSFTNWATVSVDEQLNQAARDMASIQGAPAGETWRPTEVDLSIRRGWFWHEKERAHDADTLFNVWLASVGRNAGMLLNLAPDQTGLIPAEDCLVLQQWRQLIDNFTLVNLAKGCKISCPDDDFGGLEHVIDGNPNTYWRAPNVQTQFMVDLCGPKYAVKTVAGLRLEEAIKYGQRVKGWAIDLRTWGAWIEVARGTTIGAQRIVKLEAASGDAIRLRVLDGTAPVIIRNFEVYSGTDPMH